MESNCCILKIQKTKNNSFLSLSHVNGTLIISQSLKQKNIREMKVKLLRGLVLLLKKLRKLRYKIKFFLLSIQNIANNLIPYILNLLKTWNIQILFFKYEIPLPHNGCRLSSQSRKRYKKRRKKKEIIKGL